MTRQMALVEFERVGRKRDVEPLNVEFETFGGLADVIARHVGRYLMSKEFDVDLFVKEDDGTVIVLIDGGRFGKGKATIDG